MAISRPRAFAASQFRTGAKLTSTDDPRIWETPESFHHQPGRATIDVFHNGRRLIQAETDSVLEGEFFVLESEPGTGYAIKFTRWKPNSRSVLRGSYIAR